MKFALAKVVLEIIFSYLMGSQSYAKTYAALRHYKVHRSFSRTLRSLSYSDIEYVMNVLRKYVASFDSWDYDPKLETKVRPRDRYWFSRLSSKLKVNYVPTWPSESYILENMKFSVHKTAIQCQRTLKGADGGATHEDLVSECYGLNSAGITTLSPSSVTAPANVTILGGIGYDVSCVANGGSADATVALNAHYADTAKVRVYKTTTTPKELVDVTDQVVIKNEVINGKMVTTISYTLQDGQDFDEDELSNGTIVDPLYIGVEANTAASWRV
jgi:hypothetical protein